MVKNRLPMQEMQVLSLGQEDPLEKELVTHSSILAWKMPWTEKPGRHSPCSHKESGTYERLTHTNTTLSRKEMKRKKI